MTNMAQHTATHTRKPILVTGATGRQGGTGRAVATVLLERGMPVRALVRTLDERAEALCELGLEIVVGDFGNYRGLVAALRCGIRIFLLPSGGWCRRGCRVLCGGRSGTRPEARRRSVVGYDTG